MKDMKKDKRILIPRDEFEEEAGEGLGGLSRDEAEADLLELKARMERRVAGPAARTRALWLPAAAAVVILLVASGILVTMLRDRPERSAEMALAGDAAGDTAYIAMASPVEKKEAEASVPGDPSGPSGPAMKTMEAREAAAAREARFSPPVLLSDDEVAEMAVADEVIVAEEMQAEEETDYVVYAVARGEMLEEAVVVQALPKVQVTGMAGRTKSADKTAVPAKEAKKDAAVAEPAAGVTAGNVTGVAQVSVSEASPSGGWEKYRTWVTANIRYPVGITPVVRQEVLVSFTVRPDSTLADMKAVRSPGDPFTQEVYRLLREGPRWAPAQAGGASAATEVYVMFVFRQE